MTQPVRLVRRLETATQVKGLMKRYYEGLRRGREDDKTVAWTYGPVPFELLRAMDIRFEHLESYGAYLAARQGQEHLKELSNRVGYSPDICSYARLTQGVHMLAESKDTTQVRPELLVPKPDFMLAVTSCHLMANTYDFQRRALKVPGFVIDVPFTKSMSDFKRSVAHVKRQLEDFIVFLEEMTGRAFDYDRLREIMVKVKEAAMLRVECMKLSQRTPSPMTIFDHFICLGPMHVWRGTTESVEYFKALKAEVEERVANKIGAVPDEKYRLYWDNLPIWFKVGRLSEKLGSAGANLIAGIYTHCFFYSHEPEKIDPDHPLDAIAEELAYITMVFSNVEYRTDMIQKLCEDYRINGLVMHSSRTCQPMDIGQMDIINTIEKRLGIPGVVIDGDPTDPAYYSDAQTETRLEAFLEVLQARKKAA